MEKENKRRNNNSASYIDFHFFLIFFCNVSHTDSSSERFFKTKIQKFKSNTKIWRKRTREGTTILNIMVVVVVVVRG